MGGGNKRPQLDKAAATDSAESADALPLKPSEGARARARQMPMGGLRGAIMGRYSRTKRTVIQPCFLGGRVGTRRSIERAVGSNRDVAATGEGTQIASGTEGR